MILVGSRRSVLAAGAVVAYDWVLTLGQEIELIWYPFWHTAFTPLASLTDAECNIMYYALNGTNSVVFTMLDIFMVIGLKDTAGKVWVAVKHFHSLRQFGPSTGSTIGDCFRVLIKYHVLFFARCSYWVHASSLAFENITLSLSPIPTRKLA
ncbi:hypothetical protein BDR07DRAFT_1380150 [Suillus spraguei]|nr:hypothetical protein BDR07DRAFT_1380150 [Suillus spraguei]